ncbi:MAG: hypothetical protein JNM19_07500 [Chitinophagaceae bacterium]|nr:hypothetical protein [Chitinophagaceae bacterium]
MKSFRSVSLVLALSLVLMQAQAQTEVPKGFKKGTITLADSSLLTGFIKESISHNSSLQFIGTAGGKKKQYNGSDIIAAEIEGINYRCINGDFFKVICQGELFFLQKESDASGKISYNGNEAVFSNGTDGKPGDYFIYAVAAKNLQLVSKKNFDEVVSASFGEYPAAMDKARAASGDIAELKDAVVIYNNRNSK